MNYTLVDLEKDIEDIIQELAELRAKKGHDYSGTVDTLDNLREFGSFGVLVRLGDKFKRLKHFYSQGTLSVTDETIEDTMQDLINYSLFLLILTRQERAANLTTKNSHRPSGVRSFETIQQEIAEAVQDEKTD